MVKLFPQYRGAPPGFVDYRYDVRLGEVIVPATSFLPRQSSEIRNSDAPWYWLGTTGKGTFTGIRAVLYDYLGNALNNDAIDIETNPTGKGIWISCLAGYNGQPIPNDPETLFPRNTRVMVDLQNVTAAPITVDLCFWGFKRYRLEDDPCR